MFSQVSLNSLPHIVTPLIVSKESKSRSTVLWKDPHSPSWVADVFRLWKETARPYPTSDYTVFKNGSRSIVARWKSSDGPVIIKHYKTPGLRRRVRFAFSKSRCIEELTGLVLQPHQNKKEFSKRKPRLKHDAGVECTPPATHMLIQTP